MAARPEASSENRGPARRVTDQEALDVIAKTRRVEVMKRSTTSTP
jgi:hypothetical protein